MALLTPLEYTPTIFVPQNTKIANAKFVPQNMNQTIVSRSLICMILFEKLKHLGGMNRR